MTLPDAPWRGAEGLPALLAALGAGANETRFVGGAVRDTLLGLPVADLDLATVHPPEESRRRIVAAGFRAVPTGIAHGTVTAVLPSGPVEVTTLRRDVATDGRHARVAFTDDWREDAARRDFTINALSAEPGGGAVHDYFDGVADLGAGRVRFIGDPLTRIAEDHLRILRFFRFHARFGRGDPDPAGLDACAGRANDLMALSRERIAGELMKLLATPTPATTVAIMRGHGILAPVLPEIDAGGVARLARLEHADRAEAADPALRLAALLPDDPATAERIAARLKLSNALRKRLTLAAGGPVPGDARALAYRVGTLAARDRLLLADDRDGLARLDGWTPPSLPLTGGALVARGLDPGPGVAATLAAIERRWIEAGFPEGAALAAIVDEALARAPRG